MSATEETAAIYVRRELSTWRDQARSYAVIVDSEPVRRLLPGEQTVVAVAAGTHQVTMKVGWGRSRTLSVETSPGADVFLACRPGGSAATALFDLIFRLHQWIELWQEDEDSQASPGT